VQDDWRPAWFHLVRQFFWTWRPQVDQAARLLVSLDLLTGDPARDLTTGWENYEQLLVCHPVLLVSVAALGLRALYPAASAAERVVMLRRLCNLVLELPPDAPDVTRQSALDRDLLTSANEMKVDVVFIRKRLLVEAKALRTGAPVNSENLKVALAVQPLRRWIAARLLEIETGA
jgi:hypothetical protein